MVKEKKRIALYSALLNCFLSVLKLTAGTISHSESLTADGIHSIGDFAAALSVYAGIILSNKKLKSFPYGLYKVENVISLVSAFAIFFAGYEIFRDVFFSHRMMKIQHLPIAVGTVSITIILTYIFSRYERQKGEKFNSPSLVADAEHVKTDMLSALVVLIGIFGKYLGYPIVEKIAVFIVVLFILHAGFEIMLESLKVILDASIDRNALDRIKKIMSSYPLISEVRSITGRSSGSYKFIEAEVEVATDSLEEAHNLIDEIEARIKREVPFIEKIIIHFEPEEKKELIYAILLEEDEKHVCSKFGECPKILILKKEKNSFKDLAILKNPASKIKSGKCIKLVEILVSKGVSCIAVNSLPEGEGAVFTLSYYGIRMKLIREEKLSPFIEKLKHNSICEPPLAVWNRFSCEISEEGVREDNKTY